MTLHHPKMHPQTKSGIRNSKNIRYVQDTIVLEKMSVVKVTVTQKMVHDTQSSQDASTHQIWDSYLK